MAVTIKQTEGEPDAWPEAPDNLSTAAAALDADFIWQRIEAYTAYRYTARTVTWTVEGPGGWTPPLTPATVSTVEIWQHDAWAAVTLSPSPLGGYCLPGCGPYRFTGTVGDDDADVPAAVLEAYRRLAEYMAAKPGKPGARSESVAAGSITISSTRDPAWLAKAMQNSGAADLLRGLRNV